MRIATFDVEADGLVPEATVVWCAVLKDHSTGELSEFLPHRDGPEALLRALESYDVLIGHHCIYYDFPLLRKLYGWEYTGKKVDTLIMSRTQRPGRTRPPHCPASVGGPHSVGVWGYRLGHRKVEHEEWHKYTPEMLNRCREDVEIQFKIFMALLREGKGEGWQQAHKLNFKLFHYLQLQEEFGWPVDRDWMEHCCATLERWIRRIDDAVRPSLPLLVEVGHPKSAGTYSYVRSPFLKTGDYAKITADWLASLPSRKGIEVAGPFTRVSFRTVDLDKNAEVKKFLLAQGWEPDEWNTNNDGVRTSPKLSKTDSFSGIQGSLGKLIARRVQCRHRLGVIQGWYNLIRPDGRIEAQVAGIATTGRLKHKGIVNVPGSDAFFGKWMRKVFSVSPGYVLIGCDSKGNQIRQLAARMGDEEFTQAVLYGNSADGTDLHSLNQKRAGTPTRTTAKNFFYGFIFGAGDAKVGKIIGKDAAAGKKLKEDYLDGLPKLRDLIERLTEEWRKTAKQWYNPKWNRMEYRDGYIKGLDGRPILVDSEHKVLVFTLQSDEAIQMAAAYVYFNVSMERRGYKYGTDFGSVIWYHDEFQALAREEIAEEAKTLAEESIAWAGRYYQIACPHDGDGKLGRNWMETH